MRVLGIAVYIMIICCTTYAGYGLAAYYRQRERLYFDLCALCSSLKADIGFLLLPLGDIMQGFCLNCGTIAARFAEAVRCQITSGGAVTEPQLMQSVNAEGYLSLQEKQLICGFFAMLGKSDSKTQMEVVDGYARRFAELRTSCGGENKKMAPMFKKLGFLSGVIICLFLL